MLQTTHSDVHKVLCLQSEMCFFIGKRARRYQGCTNSRFAIFICILASKRSERDAISVYKYEKSYMRICRRTWSI